MILQVLERKLKFLILEEKRKYNNWEKLNYKSKIN